MAVKCQVILSTDPVDVECDRVAFAQTEDGCAVCRRCGDGFLREGFMLKGLAASADLQVRLTAALEQLTQMRTGVESARATVNARLDGYREAHREKRCYACGKSGDSYTAMYGLESVRDFLGFALDPEYKP